MNEIQSLKKALLHCNKELVVKGIGVFKPSYKAASLSADGRTIVQPRYGWSFCLGGPAFLSASASEFLASEALASKLLAGSEKGESFEIAGLGLFYKQLGCYELMPEPGHLIAANQHYGLMPLSIHKVRTVLASDLQAPKSTVAAPTNSLLKAAAIFLGFLLLSMVAFQYFSTDGQLFIRQEAGMNIFGAERETLYQAPLIRERSSRIEDILAGINQAADSVLFERAMASETAALYIDSLSKMAPVVKLDSDLILKFNMPKSSKIDEQAIVKQQNSANEKAGNIVTTKPVLAPENNREAVVTKPFRKEQEPNAQTIPSKSNAISQPDSKNNLAKKQIETAPVDKKDKIADVVSGQGNTFIVAGSFQSLENAEKYKAELRAKGFQIAENKSILVGRLHRVVVVSSSQAVSSEEFLAKAKNEISTGVWVLKD